MGALLAGFTGKLLRTPDFAVGWEAVTAAGGVACADAVLAKPKPSKKPAVSVNEFERGRIGMPSVGTTTAELKMHSLKHLRAPSYEDSPLPRTAHRAVFFGWAFCLVVGLGCVRLFAIDSFALNLGKQSHPAN